MFLNLLWQTKNGKSVSASTADELTTSRTTTSRRKVCFLLHAQTISSQFRAATDATADHPRMTNIFGCGSSRAKMQKDIWPATRRVRTIVRGGGPLANHSILINNSALMTSPALRHRRRQRSPALHGDCCTVISWRGKALTFNPDCCATSSEITSWQLYSLVRSCSRLATLTVSPMAVR